MLLEQTFMLIGVTIFTLIQTTNTLVVLSLNIEDIQRLTGMASPQADLLMKILRQGHKRVKESTEVKKIPRKEYSEHATQRALRTYKIPKLGDHGRSDLDIVFERPSKKLKPIFRARVSDSDMTTPIASIPGDVFERYAGEMNRRGRIKNKSAKEYHEEQPIMQTGEPATPGLPDFGHKTFVKAVWKPDAIHIRQLGNRVISSIASSGRRNGGDLVLRPLLSDQYGTPPRPGEVIGRRAILSIHDNVIERIPDQIIDQRPSARRSMYNSHEVKPDPNDQSEAPPTKRRPMFNIQRNIMESIPDSRPAYHEQGRAQGGPRRAMHSIQDNVLESIPDPDKYE